MGDARAKCSTGLIYVPRRGAKFKSNWAIPFEYKRIFRYYWMPTGYPHVAYTENLDVKMMRVMFLPPQPCIRAKLARGLKKAQGKKISIVFGYLDIRSTEF